MMDKSKSLTVFFVVLTVIFAGSFVAAYASYAAANASANTNSVNYTQEVTNYDNQQGAVVLKQALSHWNDIAIENSTLVMSEYTGNATLQWIGGPLTGTYTGTTQISTTWNKFFGLWSAVWFYTTSPPTVSVNGNNATVTSLNQFIMTPFSAQQQVQYLNISYTLSYVKTGNNWLINNEVWHIVGSGIVSYSQSYVSDLEANSSPVAAAFSHWNDIAIENTTLLSTQYSSNATLHWIGGPLTGTYTGTTQISTTWNKFFGLWSAVWFYAINPPSVIMSGNMANVTSVNQFILTPADNNSQVQYINVSYTLDLAFSGGQWNIYNEIWHIVGTGDISFAQESVEYNTINSLAFSHWNNIAIEDNTTVMQEYAANATLHWANGALKGNYTGLSQINTTWNKFFGLWSAVWFYSEAPPTVTLHGNRATVNTTIQFIVQNASNSSDFKYINVTYGIEYYNIGFNPTTGQNQYMIIYENFDNTALNPISKV